MLDGVKANALGSNFAAPITAPQEIKIGYQLVQVKERIAEGIGNCPCVVVYSLYSH